MRAPRSARPRGLGGSASARAQMGTAAVVSLAHSPARHHANAPRSRPALNSGDTGSHPPAEMHIAREPVGEAMRLFLPLYHSSPPCTPLGAFEYLIEAR